METRTKSLTIVIISILLLLSTSNVLSQAQTQTPSPPTPAPSKTAPPIAEATTTVTPEDTNEQPTDQAIHVKTQADLNTLTGNIQRPNGIAWFNNKLYTACTGDWTLYEIDTNSGTTVQYLYGVRNAHSIHPILENDLLHLWIPDFQSNTLVHIFQGTSEIVTSNLSGPWGIAELDADTFAISNLSGNNLIAATKNGEAREIISGLRSPSGLANDDTYLYVANTGSTRRAVEWYERSELLNSETPIDSTVLEDRALITGLQNTTNLTIGPDGYLYFSYALGTRGVVGRVDTEVCRANGGCTSDQVEIVLYTELAAPLAGLTFSEDMKMYIHSIFSPDIYWVQLEAPDPD